MNALIVYESMFGNTRRVAEAIAAGLEAAGVPATVTSAAAAPSDLSDYPLVIIGAPTHAHTLPSRDSRTQAAQWAADPTKKLTLEPTAGASGIREWLDRIVLVGEHRFAAFSTRATMPRIFAGDAAAGIAKRLRRRGAEMAGHADFLVDMDSHLIDGEQDRARQWAAELALVPATA